MGASESSQHDQANAQPSNEKPSTLTSKNSEEGHTNPIPDAISQRRTELGSELKPPPHNYEAIVKDAAIDKSSTEKLYQQLYTGVLLNQKKQKYWVDKKSHANCFMLYARSLSITWSEDRRFWHWPYDSESDGVFVDVAELLNVCWLEVYGKLEASMLSPGVLYEFAFVVMLKDPAYGWEVPVNLRLSLPDGTKQEHKENLPPQQTPIAPQPSLQPTPPNPNPNPRPPIQQPQQLPASTIVNTQSRPPYNRPAWAQPPQQPQQTPHPHFQHFPGSAPAPPVPAFSSSAAPPVSTLPQRGGIAIGVPATPPPNFTNMTPVQPPQFTGQQFSGLARNPVAMPDTGPRSITNQLRQPIQGIQGTGMMGAPSAMRPGGVPAQHQQRPVQSSLRPQANPNTQPPNSQNFQNHSLLRASAVGSPSSSQGLQPHNQPWLPSGSQGKPPLPPTQFRPPSSTQPPQQRSILPPHHLPIANTQQQQHQISSGQQSQAALSHQQQEHYGQQYPPSRIQQSVPHQQQIARGQGIGNQKISSQPMAQSSAIQQNPSGATAVVGSGESCTRILSKRSIQELVAQIDPSETLDPEVEDILVDIADEFVESITTFGCSLAKHRKSNTLEAKDILLHLERNWNMTLPGFSGDEIKGYRKPSASEIHRERLSAIKRSMLATETTNTKASGGQAGGNVKGHLKGAANIVGSPNPRMRDAS